VSSNISKIGFSNPQLRKETIIRKEQKITKADQVIEEAPPAPPGLPGSDMFVKETIDTYDLSISAERAAKEIGCVVVRPEPNQLQLDIDNEKAYEVFLKRIEEYGRHSQLSLDVEQHESKGGYPHLHITITVTDLDGNPHVFDEWERLALQAALGSDIIRETLNMWRLLTGNDNPSRLFEPKEENR